MFQLLDRITDTRTGAEGRFQRYGLTGFAVVKFPGRRAIPIALARLRRAPRRPPRRREPDGATAEDRRRAALIGLTVAQYLEAIRP